MNRIDLTDEKQENEEIVYCFLDKKDLSINNYKYTIIKTGGMFAMI